MMGHNVRRESTTLGRPAVARCEDSCTSLEGEREVDRPSLGERDTSNWNSQQGSEGEQNQQQLVSSVLEVRPCARSTLPRTAMVRWLLLSTAYTDTGAAPGTRPAVMAAPTRDTAPRTQSRVSVSTRERRRTAEGDAGVDMTDASALDTTTRLVTDSRDWATCRLSKHDNSVGK